MNTRGSAWAIRVARRLGSYEVIEALADVMLWRGNSGAYSFR